MPLHQGAQSTEAHNSCQLLLEQPEASADDPAGKMAQHPEKQTELKLVLAEGPGKQSGSFEVTEALKQQARAAADLQLLPGWTKDTDDCGVSYYANASLDTIQYTHPALNAPPFSPDLTDYVMGHPAPHASAWAWMLYLWLRDVKSTHSVVGTLCALRLCAPPRDKLFQRRIKFRMWFMVSSLLSSTFFYASFAIRFSPNLNLLTAEELSLGQQIHACQRIPRCFLLTTAFYVVIVSVPFGIFRCERVRRSSTLRDYTHA